MLRFNPVITHKVTLKGSGEAGGQTTVENGTVYNAWLLHIQLLYITYLFLQHSKHVPSRRLRSSDSSLLAVPRVCTCFGSRSFATAAPTTWDSLPLHIRNSSSIFCSAVNSKLFSINQPSTLAPHPSTRASDSVNFLRHCALYKFTYLLTKH